MHVEAFFENKYQDGKIREIGVTRMGEDIVLNLPHISEKIILNPLELYSIIGFLFAEKFERKDK